MTPRLPLPSSHRVLVPVLVALALAVGCGEAPSAVSDAPAGTPTPSPAPGGTVPLGPALGGAAPAPIPAPGGTPPSMTTCALCHADIVERFTGHPMADAVGSIGPLTPDVLAFGEATYTISADGRFDTRFADGGVRTQQVVGRIGAGVLDTSLVVADVVAGRLGTTDHLFFAPLEFLSGHGWVPSPFVDFAGTPRAELAITAECLSCHSETDATGLPGAAAGPGRQIYPRHQLGAGALAAVAPLDCGTCHGDTSAHADRMFGPRDSDEGLGLVRFSGLDLGQRRDRCARCHLEGEARIELTDLYGGRPPADRPLMAVRPVIVPSTQDDDFRFVGQLERLSLSRCFSESPAMDCMSCHDPHSAVAAQGTADFDARCLTCHPGQDDCVRPVELAIADVTGRAARTDAGCVDCHVRRSQPFDLGHVSTADHFVRRSIPLPETLSARPASGAGPGQWAIWDDGRLAETLATPEGERWREGVLAFALYKFGHAREAAQGLARFAPPGSADALTPTAPAPLVPLETAPLFHYTRGLVLEATGDASGARAAYGDALALDPAYPEALLNRAGLRLAAGDVPGALDDAGLLLLHHPTAHKAWNLRAQAAAALGDVASTVEALVRSAELWPTDALVLRELGRAQLRLGEQAAARRTLERVRELQPSQPGLAQDLRAAGGSD